MAVSSASYFSDVYIYLRNGEGQDRRAVDVRLTNAMAASVLKKVGGVRWLANGPCHKIMLGTVCVCV